MEQSLGKVKLSKVESIIATVKKHYEDSPERLEDVELTAEFLIPSCFPEIYKNFQNNIKDQYTKGYIEGYNEGKKNSEDKISE